MGLCEECGNGTCFEGRGAVCGPVRAKLEKALKLQEYTINGMSGICDGRIYTVRDILKEVLDGDV